jgi:hypothetical protein
MGVHNFLGPSLTVDTTKPFKVVTQYLTSDNTTNGNLVEIRRLYVQNGKVIQNSACMLYFFYEFFFFFLFLQFLLMLHSSKLHWIEELRFHHRPILQ